MKDLFVYIVTNERRTTLYIGVTGDLQNRAWQHGNSEGSAFTRKYNLTDLIYFEVYPDPLAAIAREKQLKGWTRAKKEALIARLNPGWRDLGPELFGENPKTYGHPERSIGPALRADAQSKDPAESPATSPKEAQRRHRQDLCRATAQSRATRPGERRGPSTPFSPAKPGENSAQDDRGF